MFTYVVIALLILGCAFIVVEMFIPGFGIFGILGIISLALSVVVTIVKIPFGIYFVIGEAAILGIVFYGLYKYLKSKQLYGKLILSETLHKDDKEYANKTLFIGKNGYTKTSLRPYGSADFDGVEMEVCSDEGYISENKNISVIKVENNRLMVKEIKGNKQADNLSETHKKEN